MPDVTEAAAVRTARPRIFYGWYVVAGLALVSLVSVSMAGINFGFFIRPMQEDLDISETFFGWAQSARMLGFGVTSFLIGRMLDRYGARWLLIVVGIVVGGLVVAIGAIQADWQLLAIFALIGAVGMQGAGGNLYASVPIARWFWRKRGKAMSMAFMGIPAGILLTPVVTYLINTVGWRTSFVIIGIFGGAVIVLVAVFIIRRAPEDMGLAPDGEPPSPAASIEGGSEEQRSESEFSWTRGQAMRSWTFWRLILIYGLLFLSFGAVGLFRTPYFEDQGVDRQVIGFAFSAEAIASVIAAIPAGWALDRFQIRYVAAVPIAILIGAIFATIAAATAWQVFLATILFGLGAASTGVASNVIWPAYFGSLHIGAIRGRAMQIMMLFNVAGAPFAGFMKDSTGSYIPAWWAAIGGLAIAASLLLVTPKPKPPEADRASDEAAG